MNLGTVSKSSPGNYLVSYRPSDPGYSVGDDIYSGYVYMPTPYGAIDLRIQVDNTTDANNIAQGVQTQFTLTTVAQPVQIAPRLTHSILTEGFDGSTTQKLLQLTARLAQFNLPEVAHDIAWVTATLRLAGLGGGSYVTPTGVNLTAAGATARTIVTEARYKSANYDDLGNGWSRLAGRLSGDFKSHYEIRSLVTAQGYLQLTPDQAVYPMYAVNSTHLANQTYRLTFFGKPRVSGFWSLTVYGENVFLVPNELDRYSLGDRSAITYPDGSLVYGGSGDSSDTTKPFEILLQSTDVIPPYNYCSK